MSSEEFKRIMEEVFLEAAPYLHDLEWARMFFEEKLMRLSSVESALAVLEDLISRETLEYRRTDLRIIMGYLRSRACKGEDDG